VVCEWDRVYGCEFVDTSHTGLGGKLVEIRLDDREQGDVEDMLSDVFDIEIPIPDVPEPKLVEEDNGE
jgi:hypothetical protein